MDDQPNREPTQDPVPYFTPRELEMIAEAEADVAAGRVIPWDDVKAWMDSWGTENELPPPEPPMHR
jgi:hypothetical protein